MITERLAAPKMQPKLREYLTKLRDDAFLQIRDGYVDSGAAPGKDTSWQDVAQLKPETTTKEEVAARRRKKFLGIIPHGRVGPVADVGYAVGWVRAFRRGTALHRLHATGATPPAAPATPAPPPTK